LEHLAKAWLEAGQPGFRVGDVTALLLNLRFHPIQDVFRPGNDPDCLHLAVNPCAQGIRIGRSALRA
jgi:hypothetical protein